MNQKIPLHLFEAFGVELEYMLVDAVTLDVRPVCDQLFQRVSGAVGTDLEFGDIAWSNELALHVVELKTNGPASSLPGLASRFQSHVDQINREIAVEGWRLMPTAMHPWMNPDQEMKLWPHEYNPVYQAYDRIFDCRGQGWSNLQSTHLNLPFHGDAEFGRLHAAIRLLLPLLPAVAASSPVFDGQISPFADSRMEFYRTNSNRVPSLTAGIVPEPVYTESEYRQQIFERIFADIAPLDPEQVLRDEFLNSRGAIARFGRGSIEIRILDIQECPSADLALCELIVAVLQNLCAEHWQSEARQRDFLTEPLRHLMGQSIRHAEQTPIEDHDYLAHFGWNQGTCTMHQLWRHVADDLASRNQRIAQLLEGHQPLRVILDEGSLSSRIVRRLGPSVDPTGLRTVWGELCDCLATGRVFRS